MENSGDEISLARQDSETRPKNHSPQNIINTGSRETALPMATKKLKNKKEPQKKQFTYAHV